MDGSSAIPTYTPETTKEKLEKEVVAFWPRVYSLINGVLYFLLRIIKDFVIYAVRQIFR